MESKLREIDTLLANITVSGDNVLTLATARIKLKEVYDEVRKEEELCQKESL